MAKGALPPFFKLTNTITMNIYIAGKVTGEPIEACRAKFEEAEQRLRSIGVTPINPLKLGIPITATREEAMPHCMKALRCCDAVLFLIDWEHSEGSHQERGQALSWKLQLYYEADNDYDTIADHVAVNMIG